MKKFKILPILLMILMFTALLPVSALADGEPEITAKAAVLLNAETGEVYFSKNAENIVHPASTTKIMTALLVVEAIERGELSLSDEITAGDDCQYNMDESSSHANPAIEPGETMTVEDLLYCAMLVSANEACNILAKEVSGSVEAFVDAMNARAQELGCTDTHFANCNGLEDSDHYTTAQDFALIAQEAVNHNKVVELCSTLTYTVPETNVAEARELVNTNSLLNPNSDYYFEYAYGIKTGFFKNAGYCLVSAASHNDMDVICVMLGSEESGDQFGDTLEVYDWFYETYSNREILSSTATLLTLDVELGTADSTGVRADSAVSVILPKDEDISGDVTYQVTLYDLREGEALQAPVNAGQVLGEVTALLNGEVCGTSYLVATTTVEMSRVEYLRSEVSDLFQTPAVRRVLTILIILLAVYILLVVFYYYQRIRHLRSVREAKRIRAVRQAREEAEWLDFPDELEEAEIEYFPAEPEAYSEESSRSSRSSYDNDSYFDSFFK